MPIDIVEPPALESTSLQPLTTEPYSEVIAAAEETLSRQPFNRKTYWTEERRAALSEKMRKRHEEKAAEQASQLAEEPAAESAEPAEQSSASPFALTLDHEFPTSPPTPTLSESILGKDARNVGKAIDHLSAQPPSLPPALPGTPSSTYRHCPCLAVLPGRVCTFCYGTRWTKLCPKCEGEGRIQLVVRQGAERSQPCGHCGGRGTLPANAREIAEATRLAEEFAAQGGQSEIIAVGEPEFRRAVKLPGIGVTATKRGGTLAARARDRERNERRKQKRKQGKQRVGATATI